jgi:hypothetical protein
MRLKLTLLFLCFFACAGIMHAQDTIKPVSQPKMYSIETNDGAVITGALVREDSAVIVIRTASLGDVTVQKSSIKAIKEIDQSSFKKGSYWFENPNSTRYVIGPSAIPLRKGEGYYQNLYLFGQSVNFGVTDNLSIGGGTEIASLIFAQEPPFVFFLTPKYGRKLCKKVHAGAGILYVYEKLSYGSRSGNHIGIPYAIGTYGTADNNVTLGIGWLYHRVKYNYGYPVQRDTIASGFKSSPIITVSGMFRPARRFALTSENWAIPVTRTHYDYSGIPTTSTEYEFYFSYGARFIGERISVDFGFVNSSDIFENIIIGIPYIDFVVKFGGKRKI